MIRKVTLLAALATTLLMSAAVVLPGTANALTMTASRVNPQIVVEANARAVSRANPQIVVESTSPDVPREPTTQIKISGSVVNTGTQPLDGMRIRMQYSSQPFARRADMETYLTGQSTQQLSWRDERYQQSIAPSGKLPWEFVFTPQTLGISRFGVYPVVIEVRDALDQQVAAQRTLLTYMPKDLQVPRTRLALVLPIVDQPHRADDATFTDENLPASMAPGKRLDDLLKIAKDNASAKGLTWLVDPAVLDDAREAGKAHTVMSEGTTRRSPASAEASAWLNDLRTALADHPVVATPYADPDVAALAHNGVDDFTKIAIANAGRVAKDILGRDVITNINWPVGGLIDYDGLDLLATGGVDTVLLNMLNLPPVMEPATTPDAVATVQSVNGPVTALVADPGLSDALGAATSAPGSALLSRQRFIAESAMISSEPVTTTRTVIAAPPRRWDPDPAYVSDLVKTAAALPWLAPATLDTVKPGKGVPTPRAGLTYTDQDRRKELGKPYLTSVKRINTRADLTAAITTAEDFEVFDLSMLRLTSSAWRTKAETAAPYVERVGATVDARIGMVAITGTEQSRLRTLAGTNGEVPISVHNGLTGLRSQVSVRLKVTSKHPKLLRIEPYRDSEQDLITIQSGDNRIIRVPMTATASGQTTVTVQLTTSDGRKYGKPVELTVRTTGYAGIALFIVGAALVVMLAAVVMRILRRRGGRRAAAARSPKRASAPAGTES